MANGAVAALALTLGSSAFAGTGPVLDLNIFSNTGGPGLISADPTSPTGPLYNYGGEGSGFDYFDGKGNLAWQVGEWSAQYDTQAGSGDGPAPGASVDLNFSITNTQSFTDTFTVTAQLPLLQALAGGTLVGGSINGFVLDAGGAGGDGVQVTADPLYQGMVDGATVLDLGTDNFNFNLPGGAGVGMLPNIDQATTITGPMTANNNIGIEITFTLSAGDTISINSSFEILPLPAPGAIALFGFAGLLGGRRRRN